MALWGIFFGRRGIALQAARGLGLQAFVRVPAYGKYRFIRP